MIRNAISFVNRDTKRKRKKYDNNNEWTHDIKYENMIEGEARENGCNGLWNTDEVREIVTMVYEMEIEMITELNIASMTKSSDLWYDLVLRFIYVMRSHYLRDLLKLKNKASNYEKCKFCKSGRTWCKFEKCNSSSPLEELDSYKHSSCSWN